jgi:hypothetical protein
MNFLTTAGTEFTANTDHKYSAFQCFQWLILGRELALSLLLDMVSNMGFGAEGNNGLRHSIPRRVRQFFRYKTLTTNDVCSIILSYYRTKFPEAELNNE